MTARRLALVESPVQARPQCARRTSAGQAALLAYLTQPGRTQRELAERVWRKHRVHCDRAEISRLASGQRARPSLELAIALEDEIGVAVRSWLTSVPPGTRA